MVQFLLAGWFLLVWALHGFAAEPDISDERRTFCFYVENDVCADSDDQYTSGLKLTWSRYGLSGLPKDAWAHRWLYPIVNRLGFKDISGSEIALTFSIGQNIYTPEDIETSALITDDRPYAGITYAEIGFHRKSYSRMHTFGVCAGIVGPHSYAEELQTLGHDILDGDETNGWDHQLEDEPVVCGIYDYKRKLFQANLGRGVGGDVICNTGGGIGNLKTFYNIGILARYGLNVPNDFGNFPIQPATCFNGQLKGSSRGNSKKRFGIHSFMSAGAQVVFHDILLDGNTFRDSHSVDKKPVVGIFTGGIGLIYGRIKTVVAYVVRTKSFETQKDPDVFGSLSISFHY